METKKLKKLLKRLRDKHSLLLSDDRPYFYRMILAQRLEDSMSEYDENDYYQDEEDVIADLNNNFKF